MTTVEEFYTHFKHLYEIGYGDLPVPVINSNTGECKEISLLGELSESDGSVEGAQGLDIYSGKEWYVPIYV